MDKRFLSPNFPRSSAYDPEWIMASVSGGANSLWLTEWLASALQLQPGMHVLDLGCGRAASSIFLHREFGVQVWATDLWFDPSENLQRIRDAGAEKGVFPIHADARSLPFAREFFDVVISIDSFVYYGTDDLYLSYLARLVKPGGRIAIAGAGLMREFKEEVPEHLREWWEPSMWCLHSVNWWRQHWERTGIVTVELADNMADGGKVWLEWQRAICPDNSAEINALDADSGRNLGYVRVVARRDGGTSLDEPIISIPANYEYKTLLRSVASPPG
jgi:cyclopropane fatty-acyl-phospholipid synthase-like methyltransferase